MTRSPAERLHDLFLGYSQYHGRYVVKRRTEKGKLEGSAHTDPGPATVTHWEDHLHDRYGLGIIPLLDDDTVRWGGIDVDKYNLDLAGLARKLADAPFTVFRSKSGGAHLLAFFEPHCPAPVAVDWLRAWAAALGFGGSEIFPKQTSRANEKDIGNWLNAAYQGAAVKETLRYAIGQTGEALTLEAALDRCESMLLDPDDLPLPEVAESSELFEEGPPCLRTLHGLGGFPEGGRNSGMFNVAVYLKKRYPDDWREKLHEYNAAMCSPPLKDAELRTSIQRSFERKDYSYKCKEGPIAPYCNRARCLRQQFGVGEGPGGVTFEIDSITKYEGDPVYWGVELNGRRIMVTTEELASPSKFSRRAMDIITRFPSSFNAQRWAKYIDEKLQVATIVPEPDDEETTGGLFMSLVRQFLTGSNQGRSRDDVYANMPWHSEGFIWYRGEALLQYLANHNFKKLDTRQVVLKLQDKVEFRKAKWNVKGHYFNVFGVKAADLSYTPPAEDEDGKIIKVDF